MIHVFLGKGQVYTTVLIHLLWTLRYGKITLYIPLITEKENQCVLCTATTETNVCADLVL